MTTRLKLVLPILLLAALPNYDRAAYAAEPPPPEALRRPVSLVVADKYLVVAGGNGTLSLVDIDTYRVVAAMTVGQQLSDVAVTHDGRFLLATDFDTHQLVLIARDGRQLRVIGRQTVAAFPVDVAIAADGKRCSIASLWSRRISIFAIQFSGEKDAPELKLELSHTVDLPFAPRKQWIAPDGRWLVAADSFSGRLGVIDLHNARLAAIRTLDTHGDLRTGNRVGGPLSVHNIRGLASSPDGGDLMIAHQVLDPNRKTQEGAVGWGTVMVNQIRSIPLTELLDPQRMTVNSHVIKTPIRQWKIHPLGDNKDAAGDPGPILVTNRGETFVALSGTNQVAKELPLSESMRSANEGRMARKHDAAPVPLQRVDVGSRPAALALDADESRLFVANTLSDSVSVVDLSDFSVRGTIAAAPVVFSPVRSGEQLFFNARLSKKGWMSCHSCHTDGHTNGSLSDTLNDGNYGAPKRILSLLGTGQTAPWGWNGSHMKLTSQIRNSIEQTMQVGNSGLLTDDNVRALAAFLRTLEPPPSIARARGTLDEAAVRRGRLVFQNNDCGKCHTAPEYSSLKLYDVGLRDQRRASRFNPPSLRGVGQRDSFFHDGSVSQLRDVLEQFEHPNGEALPAAKLHDLIAFLNSL